MSQKRSRAENKTPKTKVKIKRVSKVTKTKPPKPTGRVKSVRHGFVDHDNVSDITESDIDALFEVSYNCMDCGSSIVLSKCWPKKQRKNPKKNSDNMLCHKCFKKSQAILNSVDLRAKEDRKEKEAAAPKKTKTAAPKKTKAAAPKKAKTVAPKKFSVGDYVLAQYPGYGDDKYYKCEIYSKYRGKFHLYYLEDSSNRKDVDENELQRVDADEAWTKKKRADYLNQPFEREGAKWQALEVGKSRNANKYGCKPIDKSASKFVWIDVAQVQKLVTFQ